MSSTLLLALVATVAAVARGDDPPPLHKLPDVAYEYATPSEPGYFPTEPVRVPVVDVTEETHNSKVLTFGLPDDASLDLPVSSALLMHVPPADDMGDDAAEGNKKKAKVLRPYNPISSNEERGSFSLLVKIYPGGKAGTYVDGLRAGDAVAFKQTKGNVKKFRHPFRNAQTGAPVTHITMLAGGTGIAPMLQALHPILAAGHGPDVRLLYGNRGMRDIMLRSELDRLQERHPHRLRVHYVVGEADDAADDGEGDAVCRDGDADGACADPAYERGWINEEKVRRLGFPPAADGSSVVWICGVDAMYVSLAGSRAKPVAAGTPVHNLGFSDKDDTVWRS